MASFIGQLNTNSVFSGLFNMIISQYTYADNIVGTNAHLVDKAKVDGTLYGDTKLYYSTPEYYSYEWDQTDGNVLEQHLPDGPETQAITFGKYRQIMMTVDRYLSKQAWKDENCFNQFQSVMQAWINDTKRIFESCNYNVFIGTTASAIGRQSLELDLSAAESGITDKESKARVRAQTIANFLANLLVDLRDLTGDFNDYGHLRSYADSEIKFIWNSKFVNEITKLDLPTIFHKEGLVDKLNEDILPARFFGRDVAASDRGSGKVIKANGEIDATKGTVRSKVEKRFTFEGKVVHVFPGKELASGVKVDNAAHTIANPDFAEDEVYIEDDKVLCKVITDFPPLMSAFQVSTSFFNPKNLRENLYLTWGYNNLEYLKGKPFITIKVK